MTGPIGAVDIGTNSVRLLVGELEDPGPRAALRPLERLMRITRLGEGLGRTGQISTAALGRTSEVLAGYREVLDRRAVRRLRVVATSAARDAANFEELSNAVAEALGQKPELLSGEDEARLAFLGATAELDGASPYLVVDIGGGSTELSFGTDGPEVVVSLDVGCVRLTEEFLHTDPPAAEELSAVVSVVHAHLEDGLRELRRADEAKTVVGLAGTVTTVAAVELGLATYDREAIHHFRLTRAACEDVFRTIATERLEDRRHNPGLDPGRADVIVGGTAILVTLMRHLELAEILVSEADILDGLVRSQVAGLPL